MPDHIPAIDFCSRSAEAVTSIQEQSFAFAYGYIRALIQDAQKLTASRTLDPVLRWTVDKVLRRMPLEKKSNNRGDNQARGVTRSNSRANPAEGESRQELCGCLAVPKPNVAARRYRATWASRARLPANPLLRDWHGACENGR